MQKLKPAQPLPVDIDEQHSVLSYHVTAADLPWHFHDAIEVLVLFEGYGTRFVGDSLEAFGPGELVILPPGLQHLWAPASLDAQWESAVFMFREDSCGHGFFNIPEMQAERNLLNRCSRGLLFNSVENRAERESLARALLLAQKSDRIIVLLQLLRLLSTDSHRPLASPVFDAQRTTDDARLPQVLEWLAQHYTEEISLDKISKRFHIHRTSFSRWFKQATGYTFSFWLNNLRVQQAGALLLHSDKSITDICFDCGFSTISHFNKQFLTIKKMSPRAYKKVNRSKPS